MKTAIVYYSKHHGNTKKVVDAIASAHEVTVFNCMDEVPDLSDFDRIGFASGIYAEHPAKQIRKFAAEHLPEQKKIFLIITAAMPNDRYFTDLTKTAEEKHCQVIGTYRCEGFNTFGPFKLIGGTSKGHPTQEELDAAVRFYEGL